MKRPRTVRTVGHVYDALPTQDAATNTLMHHAQRLRCAMLLHSAFVVDIKRANNQNTVRSPEVREGTQNHLGA